MGQASIFKVFITYWPLFLNGLLGTLKYAAIAVCIGSILGSIIAMVRLIENKFIQAIITVYVEILRGTPLLVQMYIAYYFLPLAFPFLEVIGKEGSVVLALILNSSAYITEIFRAGINAVDHGQTEAAYSLGLSKKHTLIHIILPQAIKNILPALGNEYIAMVKETSMAGTMALPELMYTRTILQNKFLIVQPLFIIAGIYLLCTLILSKLVKMLERKLSVSD